jgi:hypothetical protein
MARASVTQRRSRTGVGLYVYDATCHLCGWRQVCGGWRAAAAALREHRAATHHGRGRR